MASPQFSIYESDEIKPASPLVLIKAQRHSTRYPLALPVRFRAGGPVKGRDGEGVTRELSSHCMYVEADAAKVKPRSRMKLIAEWPVLLEGSVPLQFIVYGQVVSCDGFGFAVRITRYEYRTRRKEVIPITAGTHIAKKLPRPTATAYPLRMSASQR
jgi:hypothetical protein